MDDDPQALNEMEECFVNLANAIVEERIGLRVLAEPDGTTYPAMVDVTTDEVLGLLVVPPRVYAWGTVN